MFRPFEFWEISKKKNNKKKEKNTVKDGKSIEMACSFMCSDIWRCDEVLLADITNKAFI